MRRVLFIGAGATGGRAARILAAAGRPVVVLRRRADLVEPPLVGLRADLTDPTAIASTTLPAVGAVVVCVTAAARTEDAYRAVYVDGVAGVLAAYGAQHGPPPRVVFVSTTAVYGGHDGAVVDEATPVAPAGWNGRAMVDAEAAVVASGTPCPVIARLGGIYGAGTNRLVARVRAGEEPVGPSYPDPFTNRIHVEDAAAALAFLVEHPSPPAVVDVVDDEPARRSEVVRFLASRLGVEVPDAGPASGVGVPRDDKRVSNARLRGLGFTLRYPTYREGYDAVLADDRAR